VHQILRGEGFTQHLDGAELDSALVVPGTGERAHQNGRGLRRHVRELGQEVDPVAFAHTQIGEQHVIAAFTQAQDGVVHRFHGRDVEAAVREITRHGRAELLVVFHDQNRGHGCPAGIPASNNATKRAPR
jgi:hypothetical protein